MISLTQGVSPYAILIKCTWTLWGSAVPVSSLYLGTLRLGSSDLPKILWLICGGTMLRTQPCEMSKSELWYCSLLALPWSPISANPDWDWRWLGAGRARYSAQEECLRVWEKAACFPSSYLILSIFPLMLDPDIPTSLWEDYCGLNLSGWEAHPVAWKVFIYEKYVWEDGAEPIISNPNIFEIQA